MIFKLLLLLLIAQLINCQSLYPYQGGYQQQGVYQQQAYLNKGPVSNNGNGYAQNYGHQDNNAYIQNPYINRAEIGATQQETNIAYNDHSDFHQSTIKGRKRNAIHVKKRETINNELMETSFKVLNVLEKRQVNNYGLSYSQTYGGFMGGVSPVNNYGAGYFQTYVGKRSIGKTSK